MQRMRTPVSRRPAGNWDKFAFFFNRQTNLIKILIVIAALFSCCCLCYFPISFFPKPTPIVQASEPNTQTEVAKIVNTQLAAGSNKSAPPNPALIQPTQEIPLSTPLQPTAPAVVQPETTLDEPMNKLPSGKAPNSLVSGMLKVSFIDVGQGDSILIQTPDGKNGLIDGGEEESQALAYLHGHGVTVLDVVIATHPHSDHIGGLIQILKTISTANIVSNGQKNNTGAYEAFLDAALASNAKYYEAKRGDFIPLGGMVLTVLSPNSLDAPDLNQNSLVLKLQYGNAVFLFMGDANQDTDRDLITTGLNLQANILKIGHHASDTSTSPEFLAAVHPQIAVYSAGVGNDYGHPAPKTINLLKGAGVKTYGTDKEGTIVVSTDGTSYRVGTEKEAAPTAVSKALPAVPLKAVTPSSEIAVSNLISPIRRGDIASITIQTTPGANCSISVLYKSGPSSAAGLGPQTADASGDITWTWKVGSKTTPGTWSIRINCNQGGNTSNISVPFEVTG